MIMRTLIEIMPHGIHVWGKWRDSNISLKSKDSYMHRDCWLCNTREIKSKHLIEK